MINVVEINKPNEQNNDKKCYSCGKEFTSVNDLQRHKNRKTPCLIREIPVGQQLNPKRCIFCNKIFSTVGNLAKHATKCKIKNGGMQILDDKVRYEQEIRIMKEQLDRDRRKLEDENRLIREENRITREENKNLTARIEKIESALMANNAVNITNNTNNTTNNNIVINIQTNNYLNPNYDHLTNQNDIENSPFIALFKKAPVQAPMALFPVVWFNPEFPENYSVYLVNKQTGNVLVYNNDKWESANFHTEIADKMRDRAYSIVENMVMQPPFKLADRFEWEIGNMKRNRTDPGVIKYERDLLFNLITNNREIVEPFTKNQIAIPVMNIGIKSV